MEKVAIIGASELGIQLYHLIKESKTNYEFVGFYDDTINPKTRIVQNYIVISSINRAIFDFEDGVFDKLLFGVGYKNLSKRQKLFDDISSEIPFCSLIHKSCIIHNTATIEEGVIMYAGCIIDQNVVIKKNVLLNLGVTVAHDSRIDCHTYVSPGVVFSGKVKIGRSNFIGSGSIFIDDIKTGTNVVIGAGTVVTKDLEHNSKYVGNPSRKISI